MKKTTSLNILRNTLHTTPYLNRKHKKNEKGTDDKFYQEVHQTTRIGLPTFWFQNRGLVSWKEEEKEEEK
jgi:hypothetical protein